MTNRAIQFGLFALLLSYGQLVLAWHGPSHIDDLKLGHGQEQSSVIAELGECELGTQAHSGAVPLAHTPLAVSQPTLIIPLDNNAHLLSQVKPAPQARGPPLSI